MQTTSPGSDSIDASTFIERRPEDGKRDGSESLLLQDLSQHGGRDLIGPVMSRKTEYPVVPMFRVLR